MNIIVTGGAGFIGSNVADAFIKEGHRVIIIDDLSSGWRENINEKAEFHEMGIGDPRVEEIFKNNKIDILCHHAAQMDVRKSVADPVFDATVNIIDAIRLLEYCNKYKVGKVIFSSTGGAIYGEPEKIPADENTPALPLCPYGVSKLCFEKYLQYYKTLYGNEFTILRYANVYGPRQDPHGEAGVVAIFCGLLLEGKRPRIFGNGEQTRDYVYVGDVVKANLLALEKGNGIIANLGTGVETSVNEILKEMTDIMGKKFDPIYEPERPGEVQRICLANGKAKESLGWSPNVSLKEGMEKTIEFFRKKHEAAIRA